MSSADGSGSIPDLSRVRYFDGERLVADDLNASADVQQQLRWLHNRSLHSWGIGLGYAVTGNKGDRQVSIGPGYAVDSQGREILLTESLTKPVPARSDDGSGNPVIYYLVAAYVDDTQAVPLEQRQGECDTGGAVRLRERASIYWKAQGEGQPVQTGLEIVLAQASVQNCQLAAPLSLTQRRSARPLRQPYVAAGQTPAGQTPDQQTTWSLLEATVADQEAGKQTVVALGVQTWVDTSSAGFGTTPAYQARVSGSRVFPASQNAVNFTILLDGTAQVAGASSTGFYLQVIMPQDLNDLLVVLNPSWLFTQAVQTAQSQQSQLLQLLQNAWSVVWMGVEG